MKRNIKSISLIILCLLAYSCEWDNNEINYVEIDKPQDIAVGIDLAGVKEDETIYIYDNTTLYYSLNTQGKQVLQSTFYLDGNAIDIYNYNENNVFISIDQLDNKEHELKLVIALKTGSGSIADFANMEYYAGEYNFKIKFVKYDPGENNLKVSQSLEDNKYLKLTWNKPNLPVDKYEVYDITGNNLIATLNPDRNWFVDKNYTYGIQQYRVVAYISNSPNIYFEGYYSVKYNTINADNFKIEILGWNKAKLIFNNPNPYSFKLRIEDNYGSSYQMADINSIVFTKQAFPVFGDMLTIYLLSTGTCGNGFLGRMYIDYSDNFLENLPNVITPEIGKKQLIGSNFSDFNVYDADLKKVSNIVINYQLSSRSQINSMANGMIAIQDIDYITHFYSDNTLNRELWTLPIGAFNNFTTGKNLLAVTDPTNNILSIYNAGTKEKIYTNNYGEEKSYQRWFIPYLSYDDKYIALINRYYDDSKFWYKLCEISGDTLMVKKSEENVPVNNTVFNYNKPNEVFICYDDKFDVVNLQTMQVVKSIDGRFRGIDPITGNLLYRLITPTNQSIIQFKILNPGYTNELFSFQTKTNFDNIVLFNNYIIINGFFIHTDLIKNL